jgi:hypothetical protein
LELPEHELNRYITWTQLQSRMRLVTGSVVIWKDWEGTVHTPSQNSPARIEGKEAEMFLE